MKKDFVVERNGRSFVLYAGLLDEAHEQGLKSIVTSLIQAPSDQNGRLAICHAVVETEKGTFSGLGDAAPDSVARPMIPHLIRMAETRAKARALRDAVNVGVTALEELAGDEDQVEESPRGHLATVGSRPAYSSGSNGTNGSNGSNGTAAQAPAASATPLFPSTASSEGSVATAAQVRAVYAIARNQHGLSEAQTDERCQGIYGTKPSELSKRQASEFITTLQASPQV
ncbi:MAG: hypothetical protein ACYC4L_16155 [Chloroflexota bacterium]